MTSRSPTTCWISALRHPDMNENTGRRSSVHLSTIPAILSMSVTALPTILSPAVSEAP